MSEVISVSFSTKYKNNLVKVESELLWYDSLLMKMKRFKGGYLEFEYGEDPELVEAGYLEPWRMMPKVADSFIPEKVKVSNEKEVRKWFDDFQNYRNSNSVIISQGELGIDFSVPDNELDEFVSDCERHNFNIR
jgi:hypothetical protein